MFSQNEILSAVDIPSDYKRYYDNRVESFLLWLEDDYGVTLSPHVIDFNKKIGHILYAWYVGGFCSEDILEHMWYEYFRLVHTKEFESTLWNHQQIIENIALGNIFIWYVGDFSQLLLGCLGNSKTYETTQSIYTN